MKMKNFVMKVISLAVSTLFISLSMTTAFAASVSNTTSSSSDYLSTYYSAFTQKNADVVVTDQNDQDVTSDFFSRTIDAYYGGDFESIVAIIADENLTLWLSDDLAEDEDSSLQICALQKSKSVHKDFVKYYKDKTYGVTIGMTGRLSGTIWYNPNTDQVTKVSSATLSNTKFVDLPMGVRANLTNIKTNSNIINNRGYFKASFKVTGSGHDSKIGVLQIKVKPLR